MTGWGDGRFVHGTHLFNARKLQCLFRKTYLYAGAMGRYAYKMGFKGF